VHRTDGDVGHGNLRFAKELKQSLERTESGCLDSDTTTRGGNSGQQVLKIA